MRLVINEVWWDIEENIFDRHIWDPGSARELIGDKTVRLLAFIQFMHREVIKAIEDEIS